MSWRKEYESRRLERVLEETNGLHPRLGEWLYEATDGVGVLGRRRIITDIGAHYNKAHAQALSRGLDDDTAHAEALASLGDPKAARKKFRREHMKPGDERQMLRSLGIGPLWFLLFGIAGCGFIWAAFADGPGVEWVPVGFGVVFVLISLTWLFAIRWKRNRRIRSLTVLLLTMQMLPGMPAIYTVNENLYIMAGFTSLILAAIVGVLWTSRRLPTTLSETELNLIAKEYPNSAEWHHVNSNQE